MGEYARQYVLDNYGIDIDDGELEVRPEKKFGCSCGRVFISKDARTHHQKATGHLPSAKQLKE